MAGKKRRTRAPVKGRYKVRVIAQPIPTTPTPTAPVNLTSTVPSPTVATTSTQVSMIKSAPAPIPVMVYNLTKGNLMEFPTQQKDPRLRKILPFKLSTLHNLKLYPISQPSRSENTPPDLTPYQSP